MKQIILLLMLCTFVSCTKEAVVDDFIKFGKLRIDNKTTYETLSVELEGNRKQLPPAEIKLVTGPNKLKIWGNTSTPTDKPVLVFDTLLHVTAEGTYNFILFQTDPALRPVALINKQEAEPKPGAGLMKIKIANLATNCFSGPVDVLMKVEDFNTWDVVDIDVIKAVKASFGEYGTYTSPDPSATEGYLLFHILDPATQQPLHSGFIFGVDLRNPANGTFYNVLTLYISEKESATGEFTGTNGKKYNVGIEALFSN